MNTFTLYSHEDKGMADHLLAKLRKRFGPDHRYAFTVIGGIRYEIRIMIADDNDRPNIDFIRGYAEGYAAGVEAVLLAADEPIDFPPDAVGRCISGVVPRS